MQKKRKPKNEIISYLFWNAKTCESFDTDGWHPIYYENITRMHLITIECMIIEVDAKFGSTASLAEHIFHNPHQAIG